jgi:hypothetical protein
MEHLMSLALGLIVGVLVSLIGIQLVASHRRICGWLLRRAASNLPEEMKDRYLEEWQALLLDTQEPLGRFGEPSLGESPHGSAIHCGNPR